MNEVIEHNPKNKFFHWEISDEIESDHWQQLLRQVPYAEFARFLKENPAVKYEVTQC